LILTLIFLPQFVLAQDNAKQNNTEKNKKAALASHRDIVDIYQNPKNKLPDGIMMCKKMTISPQKFSVPLLRNRLNVYSSELEYDNAYSFYVEAKKIYDEVYTQAMRPLWQSKEYNDLKSKKEYDKTAQLEFNVFPLYSNYYLSYGKKLETDSADESKLYNSLSNVYKLLEKGSQSRYCKWKTDKNNFITALMPHAQDFRQLAKYLQDKADWEIRNGKYIDAIKTIKVGLAIGNHTQKASPTTTVGLHVGFAINQSMYSQLFHLATQPDAPNLYPALTQIKIDDNICDIINSERNIYFDKYISRDSLDKINFESDADCKNFLEKIIKPFIAAVQLFNSETEIFPKQSMLESSQALSVFCVLSYLPAKQWLRDKGLSDEKIESLSICQVVAPFTIDRIQQVYDAISVDISFKSGESYDSLKFDYECKWLDNDNASPIDLFLKMFAIPLDGIRLIKQREIQNLDRLKIIETIRYYAEVHNGKLPESLDVIKEIAVPKICPISGKPYNYKLEGKKIIFDYHSSKSNKSPDRRMEINVE
jgi:hypothetical protein